MAQSDVGNLRLKISQNILSRTKYPNAGSTEAISRKSSNG